MPETFWASLSFLVNRATADAKPKDGDSKPADGDSKGGEAAG